MSDPRHRKLLRQLHRIGLTPDAAPDADGWAAFLDRVSAAYSEGDDERYLLERSLEISSTEMADVYEELRRTSESRLAAEHARLLAVTEHSPIAIAEIDGSARVVYENPALREMYGRSLVGAGDTVFSMVHEADHQLTWDTAVATWEEGIERIANVRFRRADGSIGWMRCQVRAIRGGEDDGTDGRWFSAMADVTEEVEARAASERLTALLEAATDVVAVFQPDGSLLHLNRVGCQYLGIGGDDDLPGRNVFELFDQQSRDRLRREAMPTVQAEGGWHGEATIVGPGVSTPTSLVLLAHAAKDGDEVEYCSAIARDVTELKDVQHALAREATHDGLTELPNRTLLMDRLDHAVLRANRTESMLAVLYIDLDRVKLVNDSLGHDAGDLLLVQAAERLRNCTRALDTVGRLGGDEFVVVAEDLDSPRAGVRLAMRVVHAFNEPFDLDGTEAFVTASVGVAFRRGSHETAATLLRDADVAMYRAKESGGGRFELFDAAMRAWVTERFEMESALRHAIERDELHVHYQPQVRAETGELVGFEALARWRRPENGDISPTVFVPLAEETGLINVIGAHVLGLACREGADWNGSQIGEQPVRIAVNVSGRQLTQPGLLEVVGRVLSESGLDPKALTLEITESVLVHDPVIARARLDALRELGVRLALDDFGKGYSSLAYLQRFPLDAVKIDQVFVADLGRKGPDTTIVASVIELAHALGFEVTAEGVENDLQLATLVELGCDFVQGHVVAPALAPVRARQWIEGDRPAPIVSPSARRDPAMRS